MEMQPQPQPCTCHPQSLPNRSADCPVHGLLVGIWYSPETFGRFTREILGFDKRPPWEI